MVQRLLLDAADSFRRDGEPESRLTEILAVVLRASPQLVAWLSAKAWDVPDDEIALGWTANGHVVSTQVSLSGGGRPDMRITFRPNGPPGPVFCENKIEAGPTSGQHAPNPRHPAGCPRSQRAPEHAARTRRRAVHGAQRHGRGPGGPASRRPE